MDADSCFSAIHLMKLFIKILLLAVSLTGLSYQTFAAPACVVTIRWDASPDPDVAGYAVYYGVDGAPLTNRLDVATSTAATVKNLVAASTYSFYVVAYYSDAVESDPSNFLLYTAPAISSIHLNQLSDGTMGISFHVAPGAACHVEYTDNLSSPNWTLLTTSLGDANGLVTFSDPISSTGSRFYRAVIP